MGRAWAGAGGVSHLITYGPVILSYEVEAPVNTVGGAILSVHLLAAPCVLSQAYRRLPSLSQLDSLVTEPDLIQVNRIRLLLAVPVHLVVDCHSVPGSRAWVIEPVHSAGDSVQGDALELQAIVRSP